MNIPIKHPLLVKIIETSYLILSLFAMVLMLVNCSDDRVKSILVIGDSNAASKHGWVVQLGIIDSSLNITNMSHGGNTIGFDNENNPEKNEIKNIDQDITDAIEKNDGNTFDLILLALGTNDCQIHFADSQSVVAQNLSILIKKIHNYDFGGNENVKMIILSPPPIGPDSVLLDNFKGGSRRIKLLLPKLEQIAAENNVPFINVYAPLENIYSKYAKDGIHMNAEGQMIIARIVKDYIKIN